MMTDEENKLIQQLIREVDTRFGDIHDAMETVNDCLIKIGERLNDLESAHNIVVEYIEKIQSVDKVLYKPVGTDIQNEMEGYLNIKENLDLIYQRLGVLENNA